MRNNKIFAMPSLSRLFFLGVAIVCALLALYAVREAHAAELAEVHAAKELSDLTLYLASLIGGAIGVVMISSESTTERFGNFIISFGIAFTCAPFAADWLLRENSALDGDKTLMLSAAILGAFAAPVLRFFYSNLPRLLDKWLDRKLGGKEDGE